MKKARIIVILWMIGILLFGCREKKTDFDIIGRSWFTTDVDIEGGVTFGFREPKEEGYVRDVRYHEDFILSAMEEKYGKYKPSEEGNICGDLEINFRDTTSFTGGTSIYGIYELDKSHERIIMNIIVNTEKMSGDFEDREEPVIETVTYSYVLSDDGKNLILILENSDEKMKLRLC